MRPIQRPGREGNAASIVGVRPPRLKQQAAHLGDTSFSSERFHPDAFAQEVEDTQVIVATTQLDPRTTYEGLSPDARGRIDVAAQSLASRASNLGSGPPRLFFRDEHVVYRDSARAGALVRVARDFDLTAAALPLVVHRAGQLTNWLQRAWAAYRGHPIPGFGAAIPEATGRLSSRSEASEVGLFVDLSARQATGMVRCLADIAGVVPRLSESMRWKFDPCAFAAARAITSAGTSTELKGRLLELTAQQGLTAVGLHLVIQFATTHGQLKGCVAESRLSSPQIVEACNDVLDQLCNDREAGHLRNWFKIFMDDAERGAIFIPKDWSSGLRYDLPGAAEPLHLNVSIDA